MPSTPASRANSSSSATPRDSSGASRRASSDVTSYAAAHADLNASAPEHSPAVSDSVAMNRIVNASIALPITPAVDLVDRTHCTEEFAQRTNGEPLTVFVIVFGLQSRADYDVGGRFFAILHTTCPLKTWFMPKRSHEPADHMECLLEFEDVRDADYAIECLRRIGNPRRTTTVEPDLYVRCIAAIQYCDRLKRIFAAGHQINLPSLRTLPRTFSTNFDGQVIVQMLPAPKHHQEYVWMNGTDQGAADQLEYSNHLEDYITQRFGPVKAVRAVDDDTPHTVLMYIVEMCQPALVDAMIDHWQSFPQGVAVRDATMFVILFDRGIVDRAFPSVRALEHDNVLYPLNAFRRRWAARPAWVRGPPRHTGLDPSQRYSAPHWAPGGNHQVRNTVDENLIRQGHDVRTTIMFRNLPATFSTDQFEAFINKYAFGRFHFIYVRKDFATGDNVGYGFVDFVHPMDILPFHKHAVGTLWANSTKKIDISYATVQGQDALIEKFRNSVVMTEGRDACPRLYGTFETLNPGEHLKFPAPNNHMKVLRSAQNAETVGLFSGPKDRNRRGMLDRGNPREDFYRLENENMRLRMHLNLPYNHYFG